MQKFLNIFAAMVVVISPSVVLGATPPSSITDANKAAVIVAKELDAERAELLSKIRAARSRAVHALSVAKATAAKAEEARAASSSNKALLEERTQQWEAHASHLKERLTALESKARHICAALETANQAKCLEGFDVKEREITSRSNIVHTEHTKRTEAALKSVEFLRTGCKEGKDAEGTTLKCAAGFNARDGKVKMKVLENGDLKKTVFEFEPADSSTATPAVSSPVVRDAPPAYPNRFAPQSEGQTNNINNNFQPSTGWSATAAYGLAGVAGLVAGGAMGYLSGNPAQVKMVDGKPVDQIPGTQTRNMLVGAVVGPAITLGLTALWRAAKKE